MLPKQSTPKPLFLYGITATLMAITAISIPASKPQATTISSGHQINQPITENQPAISDTTVNNSQKIAAVSAEMALAQHLKRIKAKVYGAFWCPYCKRQRQIFGEQAFSQIKYIECDVRGSNPQPKLCRQAGVTGYPTWEIKGQRYAGMLSLRELAQLSGYRGSTNFRY